MQSRHDYTQQSNYYAPPGQSCKARPNIRIYQNPVGISLQPSPRYLRRTAIVPPRPRIPDGRYPPCGIPLDAPFGGCTAIICISACRGAARSAKGSQILLSNSGTRGRSGLLLSGRIGKNKEGIRAVKTARGLLAYGAREVKRQFLSVTSLGVAECTDMLQCVCACTREINFCLNLTSNKRCLQSGNIKGDVAINNRRASSFN